MLCIDRPAIEADLRTEALKVFHLACAVVMCLAQGLPVGGVPEQRLIALVRTLVVHHFGSSYAARFLTPRAERVLLKVTKTRIAPPRRLVPSLPGWTGCHLIKGAADRSPIKRPKSREETDQEVQFMVYP